MSAISKLKNKPIEARHSGDLAVRRREALRVARESLASMTEEEDRAITLNALADPDNPPLDDELFTRKGRPPSADPKEKVTIRLDSELVSRLRAGGKGWQTRVNDILREAVGLK